jgi:hypothetical protein
MTSMPVRRIPLSSRSHIIGRQPFVPGSRPVWHESTLERDFVTLCRFDPEVIGIEEQPVAIPWIDDCGRSHRYTPDFRVLRRSCTEIVEIKYRDDLWKNWALYKPKFRAAIVWAEQRGMRFRIRTDRHIRRPRLQNAKRLVPRMHDTVEPKYQNHILAIAGKHQAVAFKDLVEKALTPAYTNESILSAIWVLLARRHLVTDFDTEITGSSLLRLRGTVP